MSNSYEEGENEKLIVQEEETKSKILSGKNLGFIVGVLFSVTFVLGLTGIIMVFFLINKIFINLPNAIEAEGIMPHLSKLESIALAHPSKSRSVANAHNESAAYVESVLKSIGCKTVIQKFKAPVYTELSEPSLNITSPFNYPLQHMVDFRQLRYGGNGKFKFQAGINIVYQSGCEASHFTNAKDKIVLLEIKKVDCDPIDRAMLAEKAGAKGILFYNGFSSKTLSWMRVRYTNWVDGTELLRIPAFSISHSTFQTIKSANEGGNGTILSLQSNSIVKIHETFNLMCDVPGTGSTDVIVAGAHLDSVPEGPGMNDDGSGSSALLEIVVQYFKHGIKSHNTLRFAWWGAEEIGLLGSRHYVRELKKNEEEFKKVKAYLNFDMLGSPNYILGIYDGSFATNELIRDQSLKITNTFIEHFNYAQNPFKKSPLISGSDFVPFVDAGIPSGGLFTGAGAIKSDEERTKFGGFPLAAYDTCYHKSCDHYENISPIAIEIHAKAAAYTIEKLGSIENIEGYLNQK
eukprot:gene223-4469_t